jgi:hypothetical protein
MFARVSDLRVVAGIVIALVVAVLAISCDDEPREPSKTPETVEEFFEALEFGLQSDSRPYHAVIASTYTQEGRRYDASTIETWLDYSKDEGRWEFRKGADNQADLAAHVVSLYSGGALYVASLDSGEKPERRSGRSLRQCFPEAPAFMLSELTCGFLPTDMTDWESSVEAGTFEGRETVVLLLTKGALPEQYPSDVPPPPDGRPTQSPIIAAATRAEVRFHIDATSYLPVAISQGLDSDPDQLNYGGLMRFEGAFIERSALPPDAFSPSALGYVEPDEEERRLLEDPALRARVYWLGRTFAPAGLPALTDLSVQSYGPPNRPKSDAPQIQLALDYTGQGGGLVLRIFAPGDWEEFKARLGGNFPWSWCGGSREFDVGAAKVTILAAHESFPYDERTPAQATILRLGETPPTPDLRPPPVKTEPCPSTAHDRFMAEVRFSDATIVVNGPLRYGGQDGSAYGAYDSAEALEAVARALRPRQPGE